MGGVCEGADMELLSRQARLQRKEQREFKLFMEEGSINGQEKHMRKVTEI